MRECWVCGGEMRGRGRFGRYCSYRCARKMKKSALGFRERNYQVRGKTDYDEKLQEGFGILIDDDVLSREDETDVWLYENARLIAVGNII